MTQEVVNIAEAAHIYSFSNDGPRGREGIVGKRIHELSNLLLVCDPCHKTIDNTQTQRYTVEIVRKMKETHERRIELATSICPEKTTQILLYGANIGEQSSSLTWLESAEALFPDAFPSSHTAIELGMKNSSLLDRDELFWLTEKSHLKSAFDKKVLERIAAEEIRHISVFAMAPQPLLVLLGTLLTDIVPVDIFQHHHEPIRTWRWPENPGAVSSLDVSPPPAIGNVPAVVIQVSGSVADDRIYSVIPDAALWSIKVTPPDNDFINSRAQLSEFKRAARILFDRIKAQFGQATPIHIFPAAPVSVAVALGTIRMPKADSPWILYDQNASRGGFIRSIQIDSDGG